jgi:aminocarboxymuconate-semialdehyde decarboxylase
MSLPRTIDIHSHVLTEETTALMRQEVPGIAVSITRHDDDSAILDVAGTVYRPFPRGGFDVERRLQDMDAMGVDIQVLSSTPQTYLYNQDTALGAAISALQNDQIAKLVKSHPQRFLGIATLPMQAPEQAAAELRRAVRSLGLRGAMIGSNIYGKNLDDPSFEPLWAAAAELGAFLYIHPVTVAGADRLKPYYLVNLVGNPLDTTIAAACLVFGGVFERHPGLKVCLAHGGGFVPYQAGRWAHGWLVRQEPKKFIAKRPDDIVERFFYDSILHSSEALEFLIARAGAECVVLGSDYPYDMGMMDCVRQVRALAVSDAEKASILSGSAEHMLTVASSSP